MQLLAMIMSTQAPPTSDPKGAKQGVDYQKAFLDMLQKQLNYGQDANSLIFSPQFGMMTGTYDPTLLVPQAQQPYQDDLPLTTMYLNDGGVMGDIAAGMLDGRLSATQAQKLVMNALADPASDISGMPQEQLFDTVLALQKEITANASNRQKYESEAAAVAAQRTDPYAAAGLPSPLEEYTPETIGSDEFHQRMGTALGGRSEQLAALERRAAQMRDSGKAFRDSPEGGIPDAMSRLRQRTPNAPKLTDEQKRTEQVATGLQFGNYAPGGRIVTPDERAAAEEFAASGRQHTPAARPQGERQPIRTTTDEYEKLMRQVLAHRAHVEKLDARAAAWQQGRAAGKTAAGKTPLGDALAQRALMAKMLGYT